MMADVDEIIDYIKSLKKGFDKDLFQSKIDELGYAVDTNGLVYDDFHTLFKVWLNLSIPITKWVTLGACIVPPNRVEERTVQYALRWILASHGNEHNFPRINFLFDWLTAAMDCECIEMNTLDIGYEVFYTMLTYEALTPHVMKLVYTLTKPMDVSRLRVLELLEYAKKREAKRSMFRQLQILLGLFKSYKPECVPEDVPAISIYTAFRKLNVNLLGRFKRNQARQNTLRKERHHLIWINHLNSEIRNKKAECLVPNMEFVHIGSKQYTEKEPQKTYLDFSEAVSLVQYRLQHSMCRPARLRALLCNETGLLLLAVASPDDRAFFSHDLHHLLTSCFLDVSSHSYIEKQDLLRRLVLLQRTLLQGIPVVTKFLAQYIQFWNENDFYSEILELAEWVSVVCVEHVGYIVDTLTRVAFRAPPLDQAAILHTLTNMYCNLVYASKNNRQVFMGTPLSQENYLEVLHKVAASINEMCNKGLQVNPEDMRTLYSSVRSVERVAALGVTAPCTLAPPILTLALPLVSVSAALIDKTAAIVMLYKKKFMAMKRNRTLKDEAYTEQIQTLKEYTSDMIYSLYLEEAFSCRKDGLVFKKLHPQLVKELSSVIPNVDAILSIRNHLAFAPYKNTQLEAFDCRDADNKLLFNAVIDHEFTNLSGFLKEAVAELRY